MADKMLKYDADLAKEAKDEVNLLFVGLRRNKALGRKTQENILIMQKRGGKAYEMENPSDRGRE